MKSLLRHGIKVGPRLRVVGPRKPGTRNPRPRSRFKSGTGDIPKILKVGPQDPNQKLKVGPPGTPLKFTSGAHIIFLNCFIYCILDKYNKYKYYIHT